MADRLDQPIFTPATKAESGHDENLTEAEAREFVGSDRYDELRRRSLEIYARGAEYAAAHGIILADTKFEFGIVDGEIILIDEVLTPDSSRYWPADAWAPGATMPSFDKQPVRDWLEAAEWDKTPPAPELPDEVVTDTRRRYIDVYERLTGHSFAEYLRELGALDPTECHPIPHRLERSPTMRFRVNITRKEGLSDPEGVETARALADLGYDEVGEVHFGRIITLELSGDDAATATARVTEMCERLLANPVIEDYTIEEIE